MIHFNTILLISQNANIQNKQNYHHDHDHTPTSSPLPKKNKKLKKRENKKKRRMREKTTSLNTCIIKKYDFFFLNFIVGQKCMLFEISMNILRVKSGKSIARGILQEELLQKPVP
ncbi:hypothetical protein AAHE18_13G222500 [Arachis hypogaea]